MKRKKRFLSIAFFPIPRFSTVSEWLNVRLRTKQFFSFSKKQKIEMRGKRSEHSVLFNELRALDSLIVLAAKSLTSWTFYCFITLNLSFFESSYGIVQVNRFARHPWIATEVLETCLLLLVCLCFLLFLHFYVFVQFFSSTRVSNAQRKHSKIYLSDRLF